MQLSDAHDEPRGENEHRNEAEHGHHHSGRILAEVEIVEQMPGLSGVNEISLWFACRRAVDTGAWRKSEGTYAKK